MGTAFFGAEAGAYRQKPPAWQAFGPWRGIPLFVQGFSSLYKRLEHLKIR
jgi:hypothetical protein